MFRPTPEAMNMLVRRTGLKVKTVKELSHPLTVPLDNFINQLYLSSVGTQYREKQLSKDQWMEFLGGWVKGSAVHLMRRFVLVLGEKTSS